MSANFTRFFANYIEIKANDRKHIDDRWPDQRNLDTADALEQLSNYVRRLKDSHRIISVIAGLWDVQISDDLVNGAVDYELSRFAYGSATEDFEGFLKLIAATLINERQL